MDVRGVGATQKLERRQPEREGGWVSKRRVVHMDTTDGSGGLENTPGAVGEEVYIVLVDVDEDLLIPGAISPT